MSIYSGRRLRPSLLILATVGSLAIAACGSSSGGGTKTSTTASASSSRAKLAACLKQHGVTLPTRRPGSGGGGYFGGGAPPAGGSGAPPAGESGGAGGGAGGAGPFGNSSKFRTALKACGGSFGQFRPGAGSAPARFTAATLSKFVSCVRKHGYNLPKPNTSGGAIFPRSIQSNKKFQAAAKSCASLLRPSAAPPTSTSTTSSS